ncbi:MAG: ATP-binding protein [Bacteroidales bacterium]|nr:ATP-binding protein [Bacteroidales bacterium]
MTEQFVIQSTIDSLPEVEERLFHFCRECHVGNYYSAVSVATLQAVENAVVHGNASQPSKTVTLTFGTCRGGLFVEVADQGAGFDYGRYGDLPADGRQEGEGIFVMRQLADRMTYSDGGRRVRLEFVVAGIDPADALERIAVLKAHRAAVAA